MYTFKRKHPLLLGLIALFYKKLIHFSLDFFISFHSLNLARCERKRAYQYHSWVDFSTRLRDPIWDQERWARSEWLRPAEGEQIHAFLPGHQKNIEILLGFPLVFSAGIRRLKWDVSWVRAPFSMERLVLQPSFVIYADRTRKFYFVIFTEKGHELLSRAQQGEKIGSLDGESWLYGFLSEHPDPIH